MDEDDIKIPPVTMAQTMSIAAMTVQGLILHFIKPEDTEDEKVTATYICLAIFFHQLCTPAKHKDKMIGILKCIVAELEELSNGNA